MCCHPCRWRCLKASRKKWRTGVTDSCFRLDVLLLYDHGHCGCVVVANPVSFRFRRVSNNARADIAHWCRRCLSSMRKHIRNTNTFRRFPVTSAAGVCAGSITECHVMPGCEVVHMSGSAKLATDRHVDPLIHRSSCRPSDSQIVMSNLYFTDRHVDPLIHRSSCRPSDSQIVVSTVRFTERHVEPLIHRSSCRPSDSQIVMSTL